MKLDEFLAHLDKPTKSTSGYMARCPAHEDHSPSLSVAEGEGGKLLVKCLAGCATEDVTKALGLKMADLFPDDGKRNGNGRAHGNGKGSIVATYDYRDADGTLIFQVCRMDPKDFRQRKPDKTALDGWTWSTKGIKRVLYRLPEIKAAIANGETVFLAEGEKDVGALVEKGFAATCNAGGAGKWNLDYSNTLAGASVVIIADKDTSGRAHAANVAAKVHGIAASVKVVELPDVVKSEGRKPVKDAFDFFAAGGTAEELKALVDKAPVFMPREEITPLDWFKRTFPALAEIHGEPVHLIIPNNGKPRVVNLSDDFIAATQGADGKPDAPTVFQAVENRFYSYSPAEGIYLPVRDEELSARLSALLLQCARDCRESADVSALEFNFRKPSAMAGAVSRAKTLLAEPDEFFSRDMSEFIPVANGVLRLSDRELLPFAPGYRRRNKLAVRYDASAYCPLFLDTLLRPALDTHDIYLLQRWCGLALIGENLAQRMLLITGTAGGGKGTFIRVLQGIIGERNVGSLRTEFLRDRFELSGLMGKSLLYGADVADDFLNTASASALKSLTGGDPMTMEFKGGNDRVNVTCRFNVVVTSNSRLTVHLEGDTDAWRRRLIILAYEKPRPVSVIHNLSERILSEEGPGVLNWMLDGLDALRASKWQIELNEHHQRRVDDLLLESASHREFLRERLVKDSTAEGLTVADAHVAYVEFCNDRGWAAMSQNHFSKAMPEAVAQAYGLAARHDVKGADGKAKRGWKFLRTLRPGEIPPA